MLIGDIEDEGKGDENVRGEGDNLIGVWRKPFIGI